MVEQINYDFSLENYFKHSKFKKTHLLEVTNQTREI